ncbi:trypco2 family protein [Streptomyces fildesensis]|uniref:Trypco2 family protein n=1 Tax=Streptomyces fildesensis TaxID=375757 RepID=A0ABW8C6S1_9ACTN
MPRSDENWFDLKAVVRELRAQLNQAMAEGQGDAIQFELGPVELEFEVDVRRGRDLDSGLRIGVLSLGAKGSRSRGSTNRMKLVLHPQGPAGGPTRIADGEKTLPKG